MYECIACRCALINDSPYIRLCPACKEIYPVINEVGIFLLPDCFSSLQGFLIEMNEIKELFEKTDSAFWQYQQLNGIDIFSDRIETIKKGMVVNFQRLEEAYKPIADFMKNQLSDNVFLAKSSITSGFTLHDMLPYFYQDWFGTPDFYEVKKLFKRAVQAHCKDRESLAVLGAGACGLLYNMADDFQVSYGVDLSLPTLLMAKEFMEGRNLTFHLQQSDWYEIKLTPPKNTTNDIKYIVSDVMNMPFSDQSLSVVVTQYMLDFVSNPVRLANEVHRILKPNGLWINFSIPFKVPGDLTELGRRKLNELPQFFFENGFDMVQMESKFFTLLNYESIHPKIGNDKQLVHFFTLKKNKKNIKYFETSQSVFRFFQKNENVWKEIPKIVKGRELSFNKKIYFNNSGIRNELTEISVTGHSFPISSEFLFFLETIFGFIDGENNLRIIFSNLHENGLFVDEKMFLQLIYVLSVQHYLIDFV